MNGLLKFAANLRARTQRLKSAPPPLSQWIYANRAQRYRISYVKNIDRYFVLDTFYRHNRSQVMGCTRTYLEAQIIVEFFEKGRP